MNATDQDGTDEKSKRVVLKTGWYVTTEVLVTFNLESNVKSFNWIFKWQWLMYSCSVPTAYEATSITDNEQNVFGASASTASMPMGKMCSNQRIQHKPFTHITTRDVTGWSPNCGPLEFAHSLLLHTAWCCIQVSSRTYHTGWQKAWINRLSIQHTRQHLETKTRNHCRAPPHNPATRTSLENVVNSPVRSRL